jgi:hypothetical protein
MLVHTVLFWLKPELTPDQRAAFRAGLESLRKVNTIDTAYIGSPAGVPERPIIDRSYAFCLTAVFKDVAAHNAYQIDPIHKAFVQNCQQFWTRVQIYDSE